MNMANTLAEQLDDNRGPPSSAGGRSNIVPIGLEAMAVRLVERLVKIAVDGIRVRYEVGQLVHTACRDERPAAGSKAIDRLSRTLDVHPTALRRCARVWAMFTQEELEAVLALRRPDGLPVTWSHLELLSEVSRRDARWSLVQFAVAEGLSVRDLAARIRRTRRPRAVIDSASQ